MHGEVEIGNVEAMASEGQGIVRHNGRVTFIPFTAIGDTVRYRIEHSKKNYSTAILQDVIHPSADRVKPRCPYFGTCGGCQLQHIDYAAQLEYKRILVENALRKIGGFADCTIPPVTPSSVQWGYRRRISLQLVPQTHSYLAGYTSIDNESLLPVECCPIFVEESNPIVKSVSETALKLHPAGEEKGKVSILKCHGDDKYILYFHFKSMPENAEKILSGALKANHSISGIVAASQRKTLTFGATDAHTEIDGLNISFAPNAFIQSHPEQSLNIYRLIEHHAAAARPQSTLDLYCGVGITTLMVARHGGKATGIELNPQAVALAKSNASANRINNVSFEASDVAKALPSLLKQSVPDLIVINPPREGVSPDVIQSLCSRRSKSLIYISCMPSTLARDLKALCHGGYRLVSAAPFDMFPQTFHVETVAILES